MSPMTRTAFAALMLSVTAWPVAAQSSASLFQKQPAAPGAAGSAAASLFPQADLEAAADISVGIEAPQPDPLPVPQVAETTTTVTAPEVVTETEAAEVSPAEASAATPVDPQPTLAPASPTLIALTQGIRPRLRPAEIDTQVVEASAVCLAPSAVRDRDLARNAGAFDVDPNLCITEERFTEHGRPWHLVVIENRRSPRGPVWAILHDNEDSAFDAALYSVSRYGGKMIALETGESRSFQKQDPNRNFGATRGITAPCRNMVNQPAPGFTKAIQKHFDRRYPVLTMHSNDNGHAGAGGAGHISARRSSATMTGLMSPNPQGSLSDEDNAVLTAGTVPFDQNRDAQKLAKYLGAQGINMIYEHVRTNTNDCSFSFHVKLNKLGDYYNIEVEHGRVEDQKQILDALMAYLNVKPRR